MPTSVVAAWLYIITLMHHMQMLVHENFANGCRQAYEESERRNEATDPRGAVRFSSHGIHGNHFSVSHCTKSSAAMCHQSAPESVSSHDGSKGVAIRFDDRELGGSTRLF